MNSKKQKIIMMKKRAAAAVEEEEANLTFFHIFLFYSFIFSVGVR